MVEPMRIIDDFIPMPEAALGPTKTPKKASEKTPEPKKVYVPPFAIMATQCCGLHSVIGFQYHNDGGKIRDYPEELVSVEGLVRGIQLFYVETVQSNAQIAEARRDAQLKYYTAATEWDRKREGEQPVFRDPFPGYVYPPDHRPGMLLFTWNHSCYEAGAKMLAEEIKKLGLGTCTITPQTRNPNSGNLIAAMIWCIKVTAYDKYVKGLK